MPVRSPRRAAMLLATGQTTQYSSEPDDGYYRRGIPKRYEVLTTGPYAGDSNIDLVHLTDTSIAFVAATKKITDSNNGLAIFKTGETLVVSGSASNDGVYTIATGGVAGEIAVNEALSDEAAGASVSISKREVHSNNCVLDLNTGLMWSRYDSQDLGVMGPNGDGRMPWTGQLYDIFGYAAAANAANLGGYSDWRVPNAMELVSIADSEQPHGAPDATAFPSWSQANFWTSTTKASGATTSAVYVNFSQGSQGLGVAKTNTYACALVRG